MTRPIILSRSVGIFLALALAVAALSVADAGEKTAPLDINTATAEELETLPGIGPVVAQRIIEYREENGPFDRIADLLNVKGIGDQTFERLMDRITVSRSGKK